MEFKIDILKKYSDAGDRIGYWNYLGDHGFDYGNLAFGVVLNEGRFGEMANTYAMDIANLAGVSLTAAEP